jgi:hypothetical protein
LTKPFLETNQRFKMLYKWKSTINILAVPNATSAEERERERERGRETGKALAVGNERRAERLKSKD